MLYQLKPFHCPFCNICFSSGDHGRPHGASSFPLLLKCGHSVCEGCAKNSAHRHKKIVCRECQLPTDLSEGDASVAALLPDVYVLGVINANMKRSLPSLKVKLHRAMSSTDIKRRQKQNQTQCICDECLNREAIWSCVKCEENFCDICFDHVHNKGIKTMQKHERTPIDTVIYNSMIQKSCKEHTNRNLEFYCDQDNELACSHCCVTGKHKGHNVLTLRQKNVACQGELKSAFETAQEVKKRMKFSEKKILEIIPSLKTDNTPEVTKIHNYFHTLHAALQLREYELVQQIEEVNHAKIIPLEKMCQKLKDYQQNLDDLMCDSEKTLKDPSLIINSPALIMKLRETNNMPHILMPVTCVDSDPCDINCELDEVNVLPFLKSLGSISSDVRELYELKQPSDLPLDYMFDIIPDMASVTTETESVRSEPISEDSLFRSETPLTEKSSSSTLGIGEISKQRLYPLSSAERVIVSHIRDPGKFWVQRCTESKKLKVTSDAVNKWCKSIESSKHKVTHIVKGDLYLVQYSADKKWYRGRVRKIFTFSSAKAGEGKDPSSVPDPAANLIESYELTELSEVESIAVNKNLKVEILYIDYGNSEIIHVSHLRNMQTRFLNPAAMARECSLYEIFPVKPDAWSPEAVKTFARFVGNKEVLMMVSEERGGILYVDLCQAVSSDIVNDVPVSVRDALVFLDHGQFLGHKSLMHVPLPKNLRQFLPSDKLPTNTKCNVILSHITNPSLFYVQQVTTAASLSNLISDMNLTYRSDVGNALYRVFVPYVGMVCTAQYSVDKQWYRAEILNLPGGAMVEVLYVDFGNKEVLHHRHLRKLFDRFMKLSKQAIACSLAEIEPVGEEWTSEAKNWLMKMAFKKQLYLKSIGMRQDDNKANVLLFEVEREPAVCLNALMVEEGLAVARDNSFLKAHKTLNIPSNRAICEDNDIPSSAEVTQRTSVTSKKQEVACASASPSPYHSSLAKHNFKENSVPVVVSHIDSPGLFYLQLGMEMQEDFEKMMEKLQMTYKDSENFVTKVAVNGIYAVFSEKECKWYRGSVREIHECVAKVFFLDYGFIQDVGIKNICQLADHLRVEEAFALRCHLADIQPAGDTRQWSKVSIETFKDLVFSDSSIFFVKKDDQQESQYSIASELYYEVYRRGGALEPSVLEYVNISDVLVEQGFALPLRKGQEPISGKSLGDAEETSGSVNTYLPDSSLRFHSAVPSGPSAPESLKSHKTIHHKVKPSVVWIPNEVPTLQHFDAMVTYVDENGSIFLHDQEKGSLKVDLIKKALNYKYGKANHVKLHIPPPVGQACIAKFHLDNQWYRGEVINTTPDAVRVFFIDYGNTEDVSLDDICLDVIMTDIPAQGVECQLAEIEPATPDKKWTNDILDFLHLAIVNQECIVDVASPEEGKPIKVFLTLSGGIDVRNILVQMGGAVIPGIPSSDESTLNDSKETVKQDVPIFKAFKKASPLREGEPFKICVTQLLEPNFVFLQQLRIDDPASDYDKMRNVDLDNFLILNQELAEKAESFPPVERPELGVPYCAKYSYDSSWYRCEVTNVSSEGVSVLYVDYGNSEIIPVDRLRKLDNHFVEFPVQSHFCKLHNVEPAVGDVWSAEAVSDMIDALFHSAANIYARVIKSGEVCDVELLVKNDEDDSWELVYQKLFDENVIKFKAQ